MALGNWIEWLKFANAMRPVVNDVISDLFKLTGGNVEESTRLVRRIRDRGYVLEQREAAVDARIQAVRDRDKS